MKLRSALAWGGALGAAAYYLFYRRPLPRTTGSLHFPELDAPVEIRRDPRGIPHLSAQTWDDVWRALGWCHAQDRPFQLDFQRRVAAGRLSEIFGKRTLTADRFLRRLGLAVSAREEWEAADGEQRRMLQAYAQGIQRAWASQGLASEFALLGYRPEPWQPADAYLWVKALAHDLACNWEYELLRTLMQRSGVAPEKLSLCSLSPWDRMPVTGGGLTPDQLSSLLEEYAAVKESLPDGFFPSEPLGGSNAWAVSGSRSADGFPLLANDPHLALKVPDYWYEFGVEVGDYRLFGAGMPGLPGLILGQNGHVAWGVTNAYIDVQDLYAEEVDWEKREVRGPEGPEPLQHRQETILVRRSEPVSVDYYTSERGPLLWGDPAQGKAALSLAWSGRRPGGFFRALGALNRARDLASARQALQDWHLPVLNFILADRENIAHQVVGRIPRRRSGSGLVVAPAWDERWSWPGMLDFDQLPARQNPECGYVVSANHVVTSAAGHFLSWDFNPGFRAERIEQLLAQESAHTLDTFARIQTDQSTTLARRLLSQLDFLSPRGKTEESAIQRLRGWDTAMGADSVEACIYQSWLAVLGEQVLAQLLPEPLAGWLLGRRGFNPLDPLPSHATRYQGRIVEACLRRESGWLAPERSWEEQLQLAFSEALQRLQGKLGPELCEWRWGKLHTLRLEHPLSKLGNLFPALGPVPCGGDAETPNQTGTRLVDGLPGPVSIGASWRYLVRLSDGECRSAHCPGQSGHPGSRHYRDGLGPWLAGEYHTPLRASAHSRLRLSP